MMALTIWQPWASLIMVGAKPYEFRGWPAPKRLVGQRIVIHASKRRVDHREVVALCRGLHSGAIGSGLSVGPALDLLEGWARGDRALPLASGLGTAILGEPKPVTEIYANAPDSDRLDHHKWGWPLSEIQPFEPIVPARGFQGFWEWKGETA